MSEVLHAPAASRLRGLALTALLTGAGSLIAMVVFFVTDSGAPALWVSVIAGVVAVVVGIIALRRRQSKGMAVTGLVIGALCALLGVALFIFALAFLGVFMSQSPYS